MNTLNPIGFHAGVAHPLADAGLDGLHAVRPPYRGMDMKRLKTEFNDRMVFNGTVDSHHTVIEKNPADVRYDLRIRNLFLSGDIGQ